MSPLISHVGSVAFSGTGALRTLCPVRDFRFEREQGCFVAGAEGEGAR